MIEDFCLGKPLGRGKFGNVYMAKQKRTHAPVALKVLFKAPMQAANCVKLLRREVEIQCRLKHPNIVRLYGYFHDTKSVYLILEFLAQGELFKLVAKNGGTVSESTCKKYLQDIARAISYMHERHVIHRDIKLENVLVGDDGRLRVADFGWAVHCPPPCPPRYTLCGTPEYLAPEMILGTGHGKEVDLWALGVLSYELLIGKTPFLEKKRPDSGNVDDISSAEVQAQQRTYERIKQHKGQLVFPSPKSGGPDITPATQTVISHLLQSKPEDRLQAAALLESEWIQTTGPN